MASKATPVSIEAYETAREEYQGWCRSCQDWTEDSGVEPDARQYPCPDCQQNTVYGAEEACLMGLIEIDYSEGI